MNKPWWKLILSLVIALLVGIALGVGIPLSNIEAQSQPEGIKKLKLVKTADFEIPGGQPGFERWEDPEYKVVCYGVSKALLFSCLKK